MTDIRVSRPTTAVVVAVLILGSGTSTAGTDALIRIHRPAGGDRNAVIGAGVTLVAETADAWLAVGEPAAVAASVADLALATELVADPVPTATLALVGLRPGSVVDDLDVCGRVLAVGEGWHLVAADDAFPGSCVESDGWFIRPLDLEALAPNRPPPIEWAGLADRTTRLVPNPLVQEMVDAIDTPFALAHWSALSASTGWTTRHSYSQGCIDAAAYVYGLFDGLGLDTEYEHHTSGMADNVLGTLSGAVAPEEIYVAIGHLDDLPSSGPAPGADDNASGTAMVTAAAEIMSDYCFARTVRFLAVTGEEQGLHGSDHHADLAAARGDAISGVLNADMIGWEGDGQPAAEDLDVNYNSASAWLAQAMVDAAADYNTGLSVNAFLCSTMTYSDHAPFWANGYSAICGITDNEGFCGEGGNYPFYHQSSDTITNCGTGAPAFEAAAIRTYVATLAHLAEPLARIPEAPIGLQATADGDNRIVVSWSPQEPGAEVRVYRAAGGCNDPGPASFLGSTTGSFFIDTTASGSVPYAYTVVAVAAGVCSSAASTCVDASTTGACTEPPRFSGVDAVTNAASSSCLLTVDWQPPDQVWCGGPVAYNVYRSIAPGVEPSTANLVAGGLSDTVFHDSNVVFGDSYHYLVRAVDQANGNEDTNTREVSGAPTGPAVIGTWLDDAGDTNTAKLTGEPPWAVVAGAGVSGAGYATGVYSSDTCAALVSPPLILDDTPQLRFWSKFDIENGWDKGELQVSNDGGSQWVRVTMSYPGSSSYTNDECGLGTGTFFTGSQGTYTQFFADLSSWAGQEILLAWRFSSDGSVVGDGWWIDDVSITDVAVPGACYGADLIFADGFESGTLGAWAP